MDLFEAISLRHSYRGGFLDKPVPRADLEKILRAGIQAPSGCNMQTTSFVGVDDPKMIAGINEILDRQVVKEAKAIIVCVVDSSQTYKGQSYCVEDCAAAVENMLLAITALGYATVWLDGALRVDDKAGRIARLLGIPADRQVRIVLPIGVPTEKVSPKPRHPFDQRAWFNGWKKVGQ